MAARARGCRLLLELDDTLDEREEQKQTVSTKEESKNESPIEEKLNGRLEMSKAAASLRSALAIVKQQLYGKASAVEAGVASLEEALEAVKAEAAEAASAEAKGMADDQQTT